MPATESYGRMEQWRLDRRFALQHLSQRKDDEYQVVQRAYPVCHLIVETMKEAAFTVTFEGRTLFCNARFGEFAERPLERLVGHQLREFVEPRADFGRLLTAGTTCGLANTASSAPMAPGRKPMTRPTLRVTSWARRVRGAGQRAGHRLRGS